MDASVFSEICTRTVKYKVASNCPYSWRSGKHFSLDPGAKGQAEQQKTSCEQDVVQNIVFMVTGGRYRRNLHILICWA